MLYERMMADYGLFDVAEEPDGEGGFRRSLAKVGTVRAAVALDSSSEERIAERQGVSASYTVTSFQRLGFHQVLIGADGSSYRIVGATKETPQCASFSYLRCTAEAWEVPDGYEA